ncbi:hypothetical protein ACGFYV_34755 [Streptomyces sp. NPDC048297]|uniref:hypothetical protein n=1 Tax=Streptomyces sp. NPDC048297 TaxID=3365531 RepID=UPI00371F2B17
MPESFESSADRVYDASKALRAFKQAVHEVVTSFDSGVADTMHWYGQDGADDFANAEGPIYKKTVENTRNTLVALTDTFEALADGTMKNADEYVRKQGEVVDSIKHHQNQTGNRS